MVLSSWLRPIDTNIKVYMDAALLTAGPCSEWGWVMRNASGHLLQAATGLKNGVNSPEIAEAIGLHEVLGWIKQNDWHDIQVESDFLVVVQGLRLFGAMLICTLHSVE